MNKSDGNVVVLFIGVKRMEVNGSQWQSMAVNGSEWQSMAVNESEWK